MIHIYNIHIEHVWCFCITIIGFNSTPSGVPYYSLGCEPQDENQPNQFNPVRGDTNIFLGLYVSPARGSFITGNKPVAYTTGYNLSPLAEFWRLLMMGIPLNNNPKDIQNDNPIGILK